MRDGYAQENLKELGQVMIGGLKITGVVKSWLNA